jgi:hypothetical protein
MQWTPIWLTACLSAVLFSAPLSAAPAAAAPTGELPRLQTIYSNSVSVIEAKYAAQRTNAPAQYLLDLDALEKSYQQKGDIKGVVAVRSERKQFNRELVVPGPDTDGDPTELKTVRAKLRARPAELDDQKKKEMADLNAAYFNRLEGLQRELTRQGRIDAALSLQAEMDTIKNKSPTSDVSSVPSPAAKPTSPPIVAGNTQGDRIDAKHQTSRQTTLSSLTRPAIAKVIIHNTYNSRQKNAGVRSGTVALFAGETEILRKPFNIDWVVGEDSKVEVAVSPSPAIDRILIECDKSNDLICGLAEIELISKDGKNVAKRFALRVSSFHPGHEAEWLVDGVTQASREIKGNWMAVPIANTPAWVEFIDSPADGRKNPMPVSRPQTLRSEDKDRSLDQAIAHLPEEDQQAIKGLRFSQPEPSPIDSRGYTYIKGQIQVSNTGPKAAITDKLQLEMRMLCRNRDKEWSVIRCVTGFDVTDKGKQVVKVSFGQYNDLFDKLNGDRKTELHDSYTVVRYSGITVFESPCKTLSSLPTEWWKDDRLVYGK